MKTKVATYVMVSLVLFAVACDIARTGARHIAKHAHKLQQAEGQSK